MKKIVHPATVAAGDNPLITIAAATIAKKHAAVKKTPAYKQAKQKLGEGQISKSDFVKKVTKMVKTQP